MKLKNLKNKIKSKSYIPLPLIFNAYNNDFLINEYLNGIEQNMRLNATYVRNIQEINDIISSMFYDESYLFIYKADKDTLIKRNDLRTDKVIIIYEEKSPKETDIEQVDFCKLENWMIEEYAFSLLPGLNKQESNWLCKVCNYNIERISLECQKLKIFEPKEQEELFNLIIKENGYYDLSCNGLYDLNNSVIKKDILGVKSVIKDLDNIDLSSMSLISILLKNFFNIINIQMGRNIDANKLEITEKQFKALKYNTNKYSNDKIISIYRFLNSIDSKLKNGYLDIDNKEQIYYILNNIL